MKREGALIAAVAVMSIGLIDTVRSSHGPSAAPLQQAILSETAPAVTASATVPVTEQHPLEVPPISAVPAAAEDTIDGTEGVPLPATAEADPFATVASALAANDTIGAKILSEKLYTDSLTTGSIEPMRKPQTSLAKPRTATSSAIVSPEREPATPSNDNSIQAPKPRPLSQRQILPPPSVTPVPVTKPAPAARRKPAAKPSPQQRADNT